MLSPEADAGRSQRGERHLPFKSVFLARKLLVLNGRENGVLREELGTCGLSKKDVEIRTTNIPQMKHRPQGTKRMRSCPLSSTTFSNRQSACSAGK